MHELEQFQGGWNLAGPMGFASLNPSYASAAARPVGWVERSETHQSWPISGISSQTEDALTFAEQHHIRSGLVRRLGFAGSAKQVG